MHNGTSVIKVQPKGSVLDSSIVECFKLIDVLCSLEVKTVCIVPWLDMVERLRVKIQTQNKCLGETNHMAEKDQLVLDKLEAIFQAIKDMRVGLTMIIEENLVGIAKLEDEQEGV